ncbi:MAG: glucose-1-phosphate adenylyltransferase [Candidatus Villigracilaceae bacterium]
MKTRAVILAGGEGSRLSVLTAKRTKPAVPFAGKYRIIDFTLSNCVNSGIFDVMILAQYRPQSLIEHIGSGGPWDLNRDFTGGVRILTPYKTRFGSDWYAGTADAVQQNFTFIKQGSPDLILILSGDHVYSMDYDALVTFHLDHKAEVTMATIRVPLEDASRFGILDIDESYRVTSFVEKPAKPPNNLANMGVYLFNRSVLDRALWEDHRRIGSVHDFGKNILPALVAAQARLFAFPYTGYWVDVGTIESYWQAHMDLLRDKPALQLNDRSWVIHTRTEERPPAYIRSGAQVMDSLISDGCFIEDGAMVERSVLSPGVVIRKGAVVRESILFTDCQILAAARVERAILDKRVQVGENARVGAPGTGPGLTLVLIGKNSVLPAGLVVEPGAVIGSDVIPADFSSNYVKGGTTVETRRQPYEI